LHRGLADRFIGQKVDVSTVTFKSIFGRYHNIVLLSQSILRKKRPQKTYVHRQLIQMLLEISHGLRGNPHVIEHAFHLGSELEAALKLRFRT
jgi:hypothetical protein